MNNGERRSYSRAQTTFILLKPRSHATALNNTACIWIICCFLRNCCNLSMLA